MKNMIETAELHLDANGYSYKTETGTDWYGHAWKALVLTSEGEHTLRIWSTDTECELKIARADRTGYPTGTNQLTLSSPSDELIWHALELMMRDLSL